MKYIKLFEDIEEDEPEVGDYVVCKLEYVMQDPYIEYEKMIENNVGRIDDIDEEDDGKNDFVYHITYENFRPVNFGGDSFNLRKSEIRFFSKTKEDCEAYLNAKKYNL